MFTTNPNNIMETFSQRLQRFSNNSPVEFIETILNSIHNFYIPELSIAYHNKQSNLLILGIHSIIETISENVFLKKGVAGFKFYLENFVDGNADGFRFTEIADDLNDWRNVIAHQYISKLGHSLGYDYALSVGYKIDNDIILINPALMFDQFEGAFQASGNKTAKKIWDYDKLLSAEEMEKAKEEFLKKFQKR